MDTDLKGRLALITGSSRGLGREIARSLAMEGADIIINGRNRSILNETAVKIGLQSETNIHNCCIDATDSEGIREYFRSNDFWMKKLDILVNNVGNAETFGKFEDLREEDWQRSFDLTFMSTVRFINASLPYLRKSDQPRIINIASIPAHQPGYFNPHYSIAKAALLNLTKHLANYLGKDGILVNAICPSTLAGGGWDQNIKDRATREGITIEESEAIMRQEENKKSPLGKMGELKDVADLVVFLSSSKAKFLTGHCYNVDGGITRSV
jgi:3-oxoacyl-[acyl-carrier protein] reductase